MATRAREEYAAREGGASALVVRVCKAKPSFIISHELGLDQAPDAYNSFDNREDGWTKVVLKPEMAAA